LEYDWPGNIRELENVLERAINLAEENIIDIQHLPANIAGKCGTATAGIIKSLVECVDDAEKKAIAEVLQYFDMTNKRQCRR
jgi:sigma-54 dependent transcriptional regulator, acetoin dehydrogenase operon transcriptional activator AcoR